MVEFSHTPGPWRLLNRESRYAVPVVDDKAEYRIAEVLVYDGSSRKESDANARLIVAAPELLQALKAMLHEFVELPEMAHTERGYAAALARRAIGRAESEPR